MNKNEYLENSIKEALAYGEEEIKLNSASLIKAKNRLRMKEEKGEIIMSNKNKGFSLGMKRTAAVVCSLAIVAAGSITFIKPVRVFAKDVKAMVYDVIKGDDGKYTTVKVPAAQTKAPEKDIKVPQLEKKEENSKEMPKTLNGGYEFKYESPFCYNLNNHSTLSVGDKGDKKEMRKFKPADGWKTGINNFYKNASSTIIVATCEIDMPFLFNTNGEAAKGDNEKQLTIGGINVIYGEYPNARYPIVNDVEDRTQKPISVTTSHTLKWEQNGTYYTMFDHESNLGLETLKAAAETVIGSMK